MMKLSQVLADLDACESNSYILVPVNAPVNPDTEIKVVPIPEDPGADLGVPGFDYWISVFIAKDVLDAWSEWRNGAVPSAAQAVEAIVFYQENDTYLPT